MHQSQGCFLSLYSSCRVTGSKMKVLIFLACVVVAQSVPVVYHPVWWPSASAFQSKDNLGNYVFDHHTGNPAGPTYHSESGDVSGRKVGSYGVRSPDGVVRIVDYVADQNGFQANIKTTEKLAEDHKDPVGVTTTEIKAGEPMAYVQPGPPWGHGYYYAY